MTETPSAGSTKSDQAPSSSSSSPSTADRDTPDASPSDSGAASASAPASSIVASGPPPSADEVLNVNLGILGHVDR